MIELILILLAVAAVAALLGFGSLSGMALTGAKVLIAIVLVLFLLVLLGVIAIARPRPPAKGRAHEFALGIAVGAPSRLRGLECRDRDLAARDLVEIRGRGHGESVGGLDGSIDAGFGPGHAVGDLHLARSTGVAFERGVGGGNGREKEGKGEDTALHGYLRR